MENEGYPPSNNEDELNFFNANIQPYEIDMYKVNLYEATIHKIDTILGYELDAKVLDEMYQIEENKLPYNQGKKLSKAELEDKLEQRATILAEIILSNIRKNKNRFFPRGGSRSYKRNKQHNTRKSRKSRKHRKSRRNSKH